MPPLARPLGQLARPLGRQPEQLVRPPEERQEQLVQLRELAPAWFQCRSLSSLQRSPGTRPSRGNELGGKGVIPGNSTPCFPVRCQRGRYLCW